MPKQGAKYDKSQRHNITFLLEKWGLEGLKWSNEACLDAVSGITKLKKYCVFLVFVSLGVFLSSLNKKKHMENSTCLEILLSIFAIYMQCLSPKNVESIRTKGGVKY